MPLILGAIFEKIILYVEKKDVRYIALTCQLLYGLYLVHRDTNLVSKTWRSSTLHMERNDMIDTIYSSFSRKRRNNKLSKSHIQVILNDLVLVASGIRTSCLVDCVFLSMEMVKTLLLDILMKKWPFHFKQIRAICIHDNVFFLNSPIFLKQKLYDRLYHFQNHFLINVGGRRSVPRLLLPVSFDTRKLLDQDINALCDNILGTYHTKEAGVVVKTRSESQFVCCPTALAGLILDYPVIYMVTTTADSTNRMKSRENCLSMRPLTLFQQVLT
jgi:hypothetical protein